MAEPEGGAALHGILGSDWGIRNLDGVGDPQEPANRLRVLRLSALVGMGLGAIALLASVANIAEGVTAEGYDPVQVLLVAASGIGVAAIVFVLSARLPLWFVHVGALIVTAALAVAAVDAGELSVFALMSYTAVATVLALICTVRALVLHVSLMAVSTFLVISVVSDQAVLAGWVVLMGILAVSAGVAAWLADRIRILARRESDARRDAERARSELEIASGHKSAFLANMSHEFRTPLNAIIGFSDVLDEGIAGDLNPRQREYVSDIRSSGAHLLALINDVLDLAKVEAGRYELELERFPLDESLPQWVRVVRERAEANLIALHVDVPSETMWVEADERRIRQVVLNLLSNAIRFTPAGGRIDVAVRRNGSECEVSVRDTGIGIPDTDQERIFEEFVRGGTAAADVEGTGLGLALSKRFVELHGGRIWVRSVVGEGSTFTFTVPVRARRDANPQPAG